MAQRVYLTEAGIKGLEAGKVYTDDRLAGFLLKVGSDSMTFCAQRTVHGKTVRVTLGRYVRGQAPTPTDYRELAQWALGVLSKANKAPKDEAAQAVRRLHAQLQRDHAAPTRKAGRYAPQDEAVQASAQATPDEWDTFTLAQAMEEHFAGMRQRNRARSVPQVRDEIKRYMGDWMERPIAGIKRPECIDRHRKITADHGPTVANKSLRVLRACWNSAAEKFGAFERAVNPVCRFKRYWNEEAVKKPLPWPALPDWAKRANALRNSVRCDWQWFVLLTGLRSLDARTVRWEEVNITDKPTWYVNAEGERVSLDPFALHRPCPKGGERKAFTIPLSRPVVEILKRRKAENVELFGDDAGWAFPTRDRSGAVVNLSEPKEQGYVKDAKGKIARFSRNAAGEWVPDPKGRPRKFTSFATPHELRHTFASTGDEEGVNVSERVMKGLMNHTPDSTNMNHRYNKPSMDAMRAATEKISAFLIRKAGTSPSATNPAGRIVREDDAQGRATA